VLVNNAGAAFEDFGHGIPDITPKTLNDTFSLNTFGPILVTQALLKHVGWTGCMSCAMSRGGHMSGVPSMCSSVDCVDMSACSSSPSGMMLSHARCHVARLLGCVPSSHAINCIW
jgi:NAD(P)-dependent dehydrogenase (short-subunit alcohol dehydrogenase family)